MFKKLPKIAKISLSILAGLILILLLLYITIQTPLFKNQVRNYLNKKISQTTQTDFNIGKIRGNLLAEAEFSNISMKVDQDTILSISNIKLDYSPFPLLRRHVDVDSIALQSPYINLEGFLSMLDNLSKKPDSVSQPSPQDTNSESKGYRIRLADFQIKDGKINLKEFSSEIPDNINQINLQASARTDRERLILGLNRLSLKTSQPQYV